MTHSTGTESPVDVVTATPQRRLLVRLAEAVGVGLLFALPFLVLMLLVLAEAPWLQDADQAVADRLHIWVLGDEARIDFLIFVQEATQPWRLYTVSAVVLVVLLARRRYRLATWLAVATCTGWFLGFSLKLVVERARPTFPEAVETAIGFSFPSGHALNSVIFAGTMALLLDRVVHGAWRIAVWSVAVAFVLLVGFDRITLGVHYVSDVLAGWAVATAVLLTTVKGFQTWQAHEHAPEERRA